MSGKPIARCQWQREPDLADCLAALNLTAKHLALAKLGYRLQPIEAELSATGRLTVRVAWTLERPCGCGSRPGARRRSRIAETVTLDLRGAAAFRAADLLTRRAKLEASLQAVEPEERAA
ncbi:hypothetical protein [Algihabitans albus]|uniref:hypothetical protein n=1 Tax=Algihabitans albus TaxID=2164067 RepID=UPI000E5C752F|nr:hypothetical protein [Algihabitans albus]